MGGAGRQKQLTARGDCRERVSAGSPSRAGFLAPPEQAANRLLAFGFLCEECELFKAMVFQRQFA
jgi:hypothetical protein